MQYTVKSRGEYVSFESHLTEEEALAKISALPGSFAQDLAAKASRGLSPAQLAWVHKLALDADQPKPQGIDADLSGVVRLFDKAAEKLKRPRIDISLDGISLRLSRAGSMSAHQGAINVTDGLPFGQNQWFGRIERDGKLTAGRALTDTIRAILKRLADDPAAFAAEHGRKSGYCCFCGRALHDERSTSQGYGPICADRYGLPWGGVTPFGIGGSR